MTLSLVRKSPVFREELETQHHWWQNTLYLPFAFAGLSVSSLVLQAALQRRWSSNRAGKQRLTPTTTELAQLTGRKATFNRYFLAQGGWAILSFKIARLMGCLALFTLSLVSLIFQLREESDLTLLLRNGRPQIAMTFTYWYSSLLSVVSLSPCQWKTIATRHNVVVLLGTWVVYIYRDIWPLATFTLDSSDTLDALFWANFTILTIVAAFIPLLIPRQYTPINPKNPMAVPNPEQTASIASLLVYAFMDSTILEASKVPHLSHEQLPPLADYDRSKHLTEKNFPHLDPFQGAKKRHLFFNLMRVFRWEYTIMAITLIVQTFGSFASPLAINRLLAHFETDGSDAFIRPWAWVVCLSMGPMLTSICFQWYIFYAARTLARAEGLLIQLVFDHSLRIRLKAEAPGTTPSGATSTPATSSGPGEASSVGEEPPSEADASTTKTQEAIAKEKKSNNLIGKINTLVTVDVKNIGDSKDFLMIALQVPLEAALSLLFLYTVLGWSALVGFVSMVILIPVPGYLASLMQSVQSKRMEKTDSRVETVTETLSALRMVKMFGWEPKTSQTLQEKRNDELTWVLKGKTLQLGLNVVNFVIPVITMILTYATYTFVMKKSLNASKIFSSMVVFDLLRELLYRVSWFFGQALRGKVSLDRLGAFLQETELLDVFDGEAGSGISGVSDDDHTSQIGFNDATFTWSKDSNDGAQTPSSHQFRLRAEGRLTFKRNCVNLVVGPTGCGKTSVLMALLGEMHFIPSSSDSWYSLPRNGGVAYAAQESWVQNETIRDNILFGSPYEEERYRTVIRHCALEHDLESFEAGDLTEVGEKGLTLSGGQRARVTLARAVYSSAEILLLDDILAALDIHTSKWIVDKCLQGNLIRGRTVILVTHNIALTKPIADHIVSVAQDGVMHDLGNNISDAIARDSTLAHHLERDAELVEKVIEGEKVISKNDGKLVIAEEIVEGRVRWKAVKLYVLGLGGRFPILFLATWFVSVALMLTANTVAIWYLGYWGSQYESHPEGAVSVPYYIGQYTLILLLSVIAEVAANALYNLGTIRASTTIHAQLINSVLTSTLRWLDGTPAARIITRCTQDISTVDDSLPSGFFNVVRNGVAVMVNLAAPVIFTPISMIPGLLIILLGVKLGNIYLRAQMSLTREQSNAKSPPLSHLGGAIAGLVSIRAYSAQRRLKADCLKRVDHYTKVSRTSYNLNRWIVIRFNFLGAAFTACLASYLLVRRSLNAANTGFSLNRSLQLYYTILWCLGSYNAFELQSNSLERIQGYLDIDHEPKPSPSGVPPAAWPTSGALQVENLTARYSPNGPKVLRNLSFEVKSGERIGIVGRTGSGKSSLTLALLRCILTEGIVRYDGIPTNTLNLDALRSNITIIPQVPELLSGSLRRNLDPFEEHDDAALNNALRAAGLFSLQGEGDEVRLTLDSSISAGGGNLSVGQRQILALARAIVRNSKLLILDEAIDHKTDAIIQTTLRHALAPDVTVLTVAHRLQTIMDADRIMVLDSGRIIEYDSPKLLLQKKDGIFKAMVDGSSDKRDLYQAVQRRAGGPDQL